MHCPVCHTLAARSWPVEKTEQDAQVFYWIAECHACGAMFDHRCENVDQEADKEAQALVNYEFYKPAFSDDEYEKLLAINKGMIEHFARFAQDTSRYVEIGVGLGFLTRAAGSKFDRVFGLDLEVDTALQVGPVPDNVEFVVHGEYLQQETAPISALCAWHVVEHLPDPLSVLVPLFRQMPSGSIFFGQIPLYRPEHVFAAHFVFHNERSLGSMTRAYGFHPLYFERDEINQFLSFCFRRS